jgi:hypothetical protein
MEDKRLRRRDVQRGGAAAVRGVHAQRTLRTVTVGDLRSADFRNSKHHNNSFADSQLILYCKTTCPPRRLYFDLRMTNFETPTQAYQRNEFDVAPQTPHNIRTTNNRRVLGNIHNLYAPSLLGSMPAREIPSPGSVSKTRSPRFSAALKRMRDGSALQRLKQQRDLDNAKHEEAMERLRALSTNSEPTDKGLSNPSVNFGRQLPEKRRSGLARSA